MKFQLPVKGCFLQRCHEINDERKKRERERETEAGRVPRKRLNESIRSAATASRLAARVSF